MRAQQIGTVNVAQQGARNDLKFSAMSSAYSSLRAFIGSKREARRAGRYPASAATIERTPARVLMPGAVFGIFDVMREAEGEVRFPMPWSSAPETSFVETAATYAEHLREAGFEIEKQRSRRDFAIAFFTKMREAMASAALSGSRHRSAYRS